MSGEALRRGSVADTIRRHRLIVVLRRVEPFDALRRLVEDLATAGARIFEITFDAPGAADDLRRLRGQLGADALVAAGTIRSETQLTAAREAGADFAVAPLLDLELVRLSVDEGMPFVPGALTPTEIGSAWAAGATFVKLFPASAVGAGFVRELRGPMPEVELIPTGGVDRALAAELLTAGAVAVGIGGAIVRAGAVERRAIVGAVST